MNQQLIKHNSEWTSNKLQKALPCHSAHPGNLKFNASVFIYLFILTIEEEQTPQQLGFKVILT